MFDGVNYGNRFPFISTAILAVDIVLFAGIYYVSYFSNDNLPRIFLFSVIFIFLIIVSYIATTIILGIQNNLLVALGFIIASSLAIIIIDPISFFSFITKHPILYGNVLSWIQSLKRFPFDLSVSLLSFATCYAIYSINSLHHENPSKANYARYATTWSMVVLSSAGVGTWFWNIDAPARSARYSYVAFRSRSIYALPSIKSKADAFDSAYTAGKRSPLTKFIFINDAFKRGDYYVFNKVKIDENYQEMQRIYFELKKAAPTIPVDDIPYSTSKIINSYETYYSYREEAYNYLKDNSIKINSPSLKYNLEYKDLYLVPATKDNKDKFPMYNTIELSNNFNNSMKPIVGYKESDKFSLPKLYIEDPFKKNN